MYKIIVDSSCNLLKDYLDDKNIKFGLAPLKLIINGKEYIDNEDCNIDEMLTSLKDTKVKCTSSCPTPYDFESEMVDADYYFLVTISSKLSGSFNSATIAAQDKKNCFVVDSLGAAGSLQLVVDKLVELIQKELSFEEIQKQIIEYRDSLNVFFVLDRFDNFIRSGRINKVLAFIASHAHIKPLCAGENGEIKLKAKIRTMKGCLHVLVTELTKLVKDKMQPIIISHTKNLEGAEYVKNLLVDTYGFKNVTISINKALCAYYSLDGGVIVAF